MATFTHINVHSIGEAVESLAEYGGRARINAGGSDLLSVLKDDILPDHPEAVVNIKTIKGLNYIRQDGDVLRIGALALLSDLSTNPVVIGKYRMLADAARSVATPQIRNVATLGGNLCQDVRCWYYRYPRGIGGPIPCARKGKGPCLAVTGDNRYHAIMNGKKCFAVCPSDTAVALAALDARIAITGAKQTRSVATADFFTPMGTALGLDEMVREVVIPVRMVEGRQTFLKFTLRKVIDFAIVSVAAVITLKEEVCTDARIVLGAVAPGPVRAEAAEKILIGRAIDAHVATQAAEMALAKARPLSKNAYKVEIAKTLVKRAILDNPEKLR